MSENEAFEPEWVLTGKLRYSAGGTLEQEWANQYGEKEWREVPRAD